jgi:hypothetical protein
MKQKSISDYLTSKVIEKFKCKRNAAYFLAEVIDMEKETTYCIVKEYCQGKIDMKSRNFSRNGRMSNLERLSNFYFILDIDENHPIVEYTRINNFGFRYPPNIETKRDCTIDVTFGDKNYSLNNEQQKSLENMALIYARSNLKK